MDGIGAICRPRGKPRQRAPSAEAAGQAAATPRQSSPRPGNAARWPAAGVTRPLGEHDHAGSRSPSPPSPTTPPGTDHAARRHHPVTRSGMRHGRRHGMGNSGKKDLGTHFCYRGASPDPDNNGCLTSHVAPLQPVQHRLSPTIAGHRQFLSLCKYAILGGIAGRPAESLKPAVQISLHPAKGA